MDSGMIKGAIIGATLLIAGSFSGRSSPITSTAKNVFYINSKSLESSEGISKVSENFEKLDINKATLQEFQDAKCGVGEKKFGKIKSCRPYKRIQDLREKKVVGSRTYQKLKSIATVGGS